MMPRGQRAGPEGVWVMRWPWVRSSGGGRVHLLTAAGERGSSTTDNKRKRMDRGKEEEEEREQRERERERNEEMRDGWRQTEREFVGLHFRPKAKH